MPINIALIVGAGLIGGLTKHLSNRKKDHARLRAEAFAPGAYEAEKQTIRLPVQPAATCGASAGSADRRSTSSTHGKTQYQVYALSAGECEAITGLWVDGNRQELREVTREHTDSAGKYSSVELDVSGGKYEGQITIYPMLKADGDTSGAGARLLRSIAGDGWTLSEAGIGIAYCIVALTQTEKNNEGVFSGVPKLDFLLKGRKFIHPSSPKFENWGVANPNYDPTKDISDTNQPLLEQPEPAVDGQRRRRRSTTGCASGGESPSTRSTTSRSRTHSRSAKCRFRIPAPTTAIWNGTKPARGMR